MNRRDLIFAGAGFVLGFIVCKAVGKKTTVVKDMSVSDTTTETITPASTNAPAEAGTTKIEEPEVVETLDTPQVVICKEKWLKFAETQKFSSQEQTQKTYDNFMTSCVGQGQK
jgi:hypothetical protein